VSTTFRNEVAPLVRNYTVVFHEPRFTTQVECSGIEQLRGSIESTASASQIAEHLGVPLAGLKQAHFQLQSLSGLQATWAGFYGQAGKYAPFVVVRACACAGKDPEQAFSAFVP
jgi:hypothetical protein